MAKKLLICARTPAKKSLPLSTAAEPDVMPEEPADRSFRMVEIMVVILSLWAAPGRAALVVQSCFRTRDVHPDSAGRRYGAIEKYVLDGGVWGAEWGTQMLINAVSDA